MRTLALDVECPECGEIHRVDLDTLGRFDVPMPCDPESGERLVGGVDPAIWRDLLESLAAKTVH